MNKARGFTLIELVVATAIFAIMSAMVYGALDSVRQQLVFSEEAESALRELHYAMRRIALDVTQLQPRPVRDELGDRASAITAGSGSAALELSVGGWRNPMSLPRGTIQRVSYMVDGDILVRLYWPVLDRTLASEPLRTDLLQGVINVQLRYLNDAGEWIDQWPPLSASGDDVSRARPRALEILIEHEDWGIVTRVIEIAG